MNYIRDLTFQFQACIHSYVLVLDISSWVSNTSFQIQYVQNLTLDLQPLKTCSIHTLHHLSKRQLKNSSKVKNLGILITPFISLCTANQAGTPILRKYSEPGIFASTSFTSNSTILNSNWDYSNNLLISPPEFTPVSTVYIFSTLQPFFFLKDFFT